MDKKDSALAAGLIMGGLGALANSGYTRSPMTLGQRIAPGALQGFQTYMSMLPDDTPDYEYKTVEGNLVKINKKDGTHSVMESFKKDKDHKTTMYVGADDAEIHKQYGVTWPKDMGYAGAELKLNPDGTLYDIEWVQDKTSSSGKSETMKLTEAIQADRAILNDENASEADKFNASARIKRYEQRLNKLSAITGTTEHDPNARQLGGGPSLFDDLEQEVEPAMQYRDNIYSMTDNIWKQVQKNRLATGSFGITVAAVNNIASYFGKLPKVAESVQAGKNVYKADGSVAGKMDSDGLLRKFFKTTSADATGIQSRMLDLAYMIASAENDGRPSNADVDYALQRIQGLASNDPQSIQSSLNAVRESQDVRVNNLINSANRQLSRRKGMENFRFDPVTGTMIEDGFTNPAGSGFDPNKPSKTIY